MKTGSQRLSGILAALQLPIIVATFGCALTILAQPVNDNFANRTALSGSNLMVQGSLSNATFESDEPFLPGISSGQTAWWTWSAPSTAS